MTASPLLRHRLSLVLAFAVVLSPKPQAKADDATSSPALVERIYDLHQTLALQPDFDNDFGESHWGPPHSPERVDERKLAARRLSQCIDLSFHPAAVSLDDAGLHMNVRAPEAVHAQIKAYLDAATAKAPPTSHRRDPAPHHVHQIALGDRRGVSDEGA